MFSICLSFYDSGTYGSKWLEIVQMYDKKVVTHYDPPPPPTAILSGSSSNPTTLSKDSKYAVQV